MTNRIFAGVLIALIGWASVSSAQVKVPARVLFIGNSYTFYNKLPELFADMVKSAGVKAPLVKSHTPGGCTLIKHSKDPKAPSGSCRLGVFLLFCLPSRILT